MSEDNAIIAVAKVSPSQKLRYKITPETDKLLPADSLGKQLTALSDIFSELAKQDGFKCKTLVHGLSMDENGEITIDLVLAHSRDDKAALAEKPKAPPDWDGIKSA